MPRCRDGCRVPGIPLAICRPEWDLVLLDSLKKKLSFIDQSISSLELVNARTLHARAEDAGQNAEFREQFDVVVSRAVARLPVLLELCIPLLKVGGTFIAMKGAEGIEEVEESGNALKELLSSVDQVFNLELPFQMGQRTLIVIRKDAATDERYPRRAGIPAKRL